MIVTSSSANLGQLDISQWPQNAGLYKALFFRSFHPDVWPTVSKRSGLQLLKWEVRRSLEQGFSPPNLIKCLEPDFEQSWIISGQRFLPQGPAGDWVLRQELTSFEGQAWNTCPSKFGASIPNLWACSSSAPVYSCANQPTKVMQCISPENKRNWWIPLNYKPKKSY